MHTPLSHKPRLLGRRHHRHPDEPRAHGESAGMALLLLLALAQLMVILDITAVNVALPDLAKDLSISGGNLGWTITSYSLVFGSLLLLGGRATEQQQAAEDQRVARNRPAEVAAGDAEVLSQVRK